MLQMSQDWLDFVIGCFIQEFERKWAADCGMAHGVATSNRLTMPHASKIVKQVEINPCP
jgi:hypothetical protein